MAKIATFLPAVLVEAPAVPAPLAEAYVLRAANEFCRRSLVWSELAESIPLVNDEREYDIDLPSGAVLAQVIDVWIGARTLRGVDLGLIASVLSEWQGATGAPTYFTVSARAPATLSFYPLPSGLPVGTTFTPRYAYAPALTATSLPDFLAADFLFDIATGALAYLLFMNGVPWANPQLAIEKRTAFDRAIGNARIDAMHAQTVGASTAKPRCF